MRQTGRRTLAGIAVAVAGSLTAGVALAGPVLTPNVVIDNPTPGGGDNFGWSVALDGGQVLVGAQFDDTGAPNTGSAYLFNAATGNLLQTFNNPAPDNSDQFGYSVALDDGRVLVGAYGDDTGASNAGSAYLFDAANGTLLQTFNNPTPDTSDWFGFSVALDGTRVGVSAPFDDTAFTNAGTVYFFDAVTGTPIGEVYGEQRDAFAGYYNSAVSIADGTAAIGAPIGAVANATGSISPLYS